jgi:hypothetical protein
MMPTGYIIFNTLVIRDSFYKKIVGSNWIFFGAYYFVFHGEFVNSSVVLFMCSLV